MSDEFRALPIAAHTADHLAVIAGLPCATTYFAAELYRDLLARRHGACEVVVLNDLGDETRARIAAAQVPILFLCEIPDAATVTTIAGSDLPVLVVEHAFSDACRDFITARDARLIDTVRTMARAHVGIAALLDIPRSILLSPDRAAPAAALVDRLAIESSVTPAQSEAMIGERYLDRTLGTVLASPDPTARPGDPLQAAADDLLGRLDRLYDLHAERRDAHWAMPIDLLIEAAPPHLAATGPIALLGPARCLSFGPYLHLVDGPWRATVTFATRGNRSGNTIGFDVSADDGIKFEESFELTRSGTFAMDCDFVVSDRYRPFEFRTHLRRGAIDGDIQLLSLELERGG